MNHTRSARLVVVALMALVLSACIGGVEDTGDDGFIGGTGEITVHDHIYRMGWCGHRKNLALMEEIAAVLVEAQPVEDTE